MNITVDYDVAIRHFANFLSFPTQADQNTFKSELKNITKNASLMVEAYSRHVSIDMEKEEMLRDVCFIGGVTLWRLNHKKYIYDALVLASVDIVELATGRTYENQFIKKLKKCKDYFIFSNGTSTSSITFATVPFYLLFKSMIRSKDTDLLFDVPQESVE